MDIGTGTGLLALMAARCAHTPQSPDAAADAHPASGVNSGGITPDHSHSQMQHTILAAAYHVCLLLCMRCSLVITCWNTCMQLGQSGRMRA